MPAPKKGMHFPDVACPHASAAALGPLITSDVGQQHTEEEDNPFRPKMQQEGVGARQSGSTEKGKEEDEVANSIHPGRPTPGSQPLGKEVAPIWSTYVRKSTAGNSGQQNRS